MLDPSKLLIIRNNKEGSLRLFCRRLFLKVKLGILWFWAISSFRISFKRSKNVWGHTTNTKDLIVCCCCFWSVGCHYLSKIENFRTSEKCHACLQEEVVQKWHKFNHIKSAVANSADNGSKLHFCTFILLRLYAIWLRQLLSSHSGLGKCEEWDKQARITCIMGAKAYIMRLHAG